MHCLMKNSVHLDGERILGGYKVVLQNIRAQVTKKWETSRILQYEQKHMQRDLRKNLKREGKQE